MSEPILAAPAAAAAQSTGGSRAAAAAMPRAQHDRMANAIRALAMDAVEQAKSGHPGMPMGMADVATVLFTAVPEVRSDRPAWPDRDRFVLSAGHGSMLLYALLYLLGYEDMTLDEIKHFRQLGSKTPGHPENFVTAGIETTTGPLGQGLANAVGMAIAEAHLAARVRRRPRRSPHLGDRRRRLPDGRHQPGGDRARRPPEAQQADRHLRRQRHLDRRRRSRFPNSTDQIARFEAAGWNAIARRRPRPGRDRRGDRGGAEVRPADDDRLQDHHRLRRADEGRHGQGARRAARRGRACGRAQERSAGTYGAVRGSRRHPRRLAQRRRTRRRARARHGQKRLDALPADSAPSSSAACAGDAAGQASTPRSQRYKREARRREADGRDAQARRRSRST